MLTIMKNITFLAIIVILSTGCATPFQSVANYYDSRDPCQSVGKGDDWKMPNFCGGNRSYSIVTTQQVGEGRFVSRVVNY